MSNDQTIPAELAARCEVLVGWRPAPGLLGAMPRLRWIQSTTEVFVANAQRFLAGEPLRTAVDRALGC